DESEATPVGHGARLRLDQEGAVLVEAAGRHFIDDGGFAGGKPQKIAVAALQRPGYARATRKRRGPGPMPRPALNRDQDLRTHPADHVRKFGAARVAGDMHEMSAVRDHLDALGDEPVDHPHDRLLVAGYGA